MTTSIVFVSNNYLGISKLCYALRQHYPVSVQSSESIESSDDPFGSFNCAIIDYTAGGIPLKTKPPIFTIGLVQDPETETIIRLLNLTDLSLSSQLPLDHLHHYFQPHYRQLIDQKTLPIQSSVLLIGPFVECLSNFQDQLLPFHCLHAPTALDGITLWRTHTSCVRLVIVDQAIDTAIIQHEIQLSRSIIIVYSPNTTPSAEHYFNHGYHGIVAHPKDLLSELVDIGSIPKPTVSSQQNATFIMEDIHQKRMQKLSRDYHQLPLDYQSIIPRSTAIPRIEAKSFKNTRDTLCRDTGLPQPSYQPQPVLFIGDALASVANTLPTQSLIPHCVPTLDDAIQRIQTHNFSAIISPIMLPDGMIQDWLCPIYEQLFIRNVVSKIIVISHDLRLKTTSQLLRRHVNYRLNDPVDPQVLVGILEPWAREFFYIQSCYTLLEKLLKTPCNQALKSALSQHLPPELMSML